MGQLVSKDRHATAGGTTVRQDGGLVFDGVVGVLRQQCLLEGTTISGKVALGAGCFWGLDHYITKQFQNHIHRARVGFMSPNSNATRTNISYQEVCQGRSGYVEVLLVELRDPQTHFEDLVRYFFSIHDPTTLNRQGSDRGSQYQSIIFCDDEHQVEIATRVKEELQQHLNCGAVLCFEKKTVRTRIVSMSYFIEATERHQNYLNNNPNGYCNHFVRVRDRRPPRIQRQYRLNLATPFGLFLPTWG